MTMTDDDLLAEKEEEAQSPDVAPTLLCGFEGCGYTPPLAAGSGGERALGAHRYHAHGIKGQGKKKARRDRAPRSATININAAPRPNRAQADRAKSEEKVKGLLAVLAGTLNALGETTDAAIIQAHRETVAAALAQLAEYEPWLKKLLSGGKASDRMLAWVATVMALAAMLIPIADHHGLIPAELKRQLAGFGLAQGPPVAAMGDSAGDGGYVPKHAAA